MVRLEEYVFTQATLQHKTQPLMESNGGCIARQHLAAEFVYTQSCKSKVHCAFA